MNITITIDLSPVHKVPERTSYHWDDEIKVSRLSKSASVNIKLIKSMHEWVSEHISKHMNFQSDHPRILCNFLY